MKIKSLRVNSGRANVGAWVKDIPTMDDLRLHVRGFANPDYQAAIAAETSRIGVEGRVGGRRDGALKPEVFDEVQNKCIVSSILLDWRGLEDDAGDPITFNAAAALIYLNDPDYRPLREAVLFAAREVEQSDSDRIEISAGN